LGPSTEKRKSQRLGYESAILKEEKGGLGAMDLEKLGAHLATWCTAGSLQRCCQFTNQNKHGDVVEASKVWWEEAKEKVEDPKTTQP
jgi:hypothetical protein